MIPILGPWLDRRREAKRMLYWKGVYERIDKNKQQEARVVYRMIWHTADGLRCIDSEMIADMPNAIVERALRPEPRLVSVTDSPPSNSLPEFRRRRYRLENIGPGMLEPRGDARDLASQHYLEIRDCMLYEVQE
jgi:hypothetical protein